MANQVTHTHSGQVRAWVCSHNYKEKGGREGEIGNAYIKESLVGSNLRILAWRRRRNGGVLLIASWLSLSCDQLRGISSKLVGTLVAQKWLVTDRWRNQWQEDWKNSPSVGNSRRDRPFFLILSNRRAREDGKKVKKKRLHNKFLLPFCASIPRRDAIIKHVMNSIICCSFLFF